MNDFVFFAAAYGAAVSLTLLKVGAWYQAVGERLDRALFWKRWLASIPENQRGGPIRTLVHCPACTGFWCALGLSFWRFPGPLAGGIEVWATRVVWALAATGLIYAVHVTMTKLGQYEL